MVSQLYKKYASIFFILILLSVVFLIIRPFLVSILTAIVLGYIFYPVYRFFRKIIRNKTISALLVSILTLAILLIPITYIIFGLQQQSSSLYEYTKENLTKENLDVFCTYAEGLCNYITSAGDSLLSSNLENYVNLQEITKTFSDYITNWITGLLLSIPRLILDFFIIVFMMYYTFKDGDKLADFISGSINSTKAKKQEFFAKTRGIVNSILFGSIVAAIIQGILGGVGFWILGLNSPILWGLVMAVFALIPFVGTGVVWAPASLYLIIDGLSTGTWWYGIALLIYGFFIIGSIDNVLRPILIGTRSDVHPAIILLGVLGGIPLFGIMGIVLGPLILGIGITTAHIFSEEDTR